MKTHLAIVAAAATLALGACATKQSQESVAFDTSAIRPVLPESKLPPAAPGVYDLSNVDSPPAPLKYATLNGLTRAFDRRVLPLGSGAATVVYTVTEKGAVSDVAVYAATNRAYANAVTAIVRGWKFKPAQKNGHAVACRTSWGVSLTFNEREPPIAHVWNDYRGLGPVSQYDR